MTTSKRITIFEGCDATGKSTAAKAYAQATQARYIHLGPFKGLTTNLARFYVDAMLPAVLGYEDVVLDRSWLSEVPYGVAFRDGQDRIKEPGRRMLERLALRCGAVVVWCDPGWDRVLSSWQRRQQEEMLAHEAQLKRVYELYQRAQAGEPNLGTCLPNKVFDYTKTSILLLWMSIMNAHHPLALASAGQWDASVVLVGEGFAHHGPHDPLYQWPFAQFDQGGCSWWLTQQLIDAKIPESKLLWVNADQDLSLLPSLEGKTVVALGDVAARQLTRLGLACTQLKHPQHHKRFTSKLAYPLIELLQKELGL